MSILGNRVARREDPAFLAGGGVYVADLDLDDEAHLVYVRSDVAHGRITSIDTSGAERAPGVVGVFQASDIGDLGLAPHVLPVFPEATKRHFLAADTVRYVGEPVVAVLADTYAQAVDAAELVFVEYEALPAGVDVEAAARDETL
ncbi:MAG: xanthine dehydrogenase family protein molybdopterin-binding subunit, partial [Ilumatobacter sp.]